MNRPTTQKMNCPTPNSGTAPDPSARQLLKNLRPRLIYLRPADRVLLELALAGERSKRDIARAMDIEPGTVTRRLARLINRLSSGLVNALLSDTCTLDPDLRQLALEYFLGDLSQRELADQHRMTPGAVSRAIQYGRGWCGEGKPSPRKTGNTRR
jgi:DNA-directed RNA polymerase specialized sigma24 family protein